MHRSAGISLARATALGLLGWSLAGPAARAQDPQPIGMLLAAGDIAECLGAKDDDASDEDKRNKTGAATAELIKQEIARAKAKHPNIEIRVLALGDLAYDCGRTKAFKCFDATWGQFKDIMLPVPGNHEYDAKKGVPPNDVCVTKESEKTKERKHAKPYFEYFKNHEFAGKESGFYAVRFPDRTNGPWLLVGLSIYRNFSVSALKTRLAAEQNMPCVLAFSHATLYSSGRHGHGQSSDIDLEAELPVKKDKPEVLREMFRVLHQARVSVIVAGHDHHYEQLGRANAEGEAHENGKPAMVDDGVRSFIVGTGGTDLHSERPSGNTNLYAQRWAFQEAYDLNSRGILRIMLYPRSYAWEFVPTKDNSGSMTVVKNVKSDGCNRP